MLRIREENTRSTSGQVFLMQSDKVLITRKAIATTSLPCIRFALAVRADLE